MLTELVALGWVVLIDLALSMDNAAVISLTAQQVPEDKRMEVQYLGIAAAVVFRVLFALLAAVFMRHAVFTLLGGMYLVIVCYRMVRDRNKPPEASSLFGLLGPIAQIVLADLTMSMDNVIAVGAVARNHPGMIVFGIMLSVALMTLATELFSYSMKRWPNTYYLAVGAVALTAGKMLTEGLFARV
jgi:YjbE family integral membrane protein